MGILATLRLEKAGEWKSLADYLREARHRETGALAALANALSAPPHEQKELAEQQDAGPVLLDLACDLRVPKGARLGAARCLLEAGIEPPHIGSLFIGAGDLVTDPRLGNAARKLVEGGLPSALQLGGETAQVSLAAGSFARAVHAAASAVGQARTKELLAGAPPFHAGAMAALFALGQGELPAVQLPQWKKLLDETCAANRRAPAAAKRMGLAPPWPPNLPDAFAPLLKEAEEKNVGVVAADAAANPSALKKSPAGPVVAGRAAPPPPAKPAAPAAAGKTMAPPIKRSPFRKAIGAVIEVPTTLPPKPMEPVTGRPSPTAAPPEAQRPRVEPREEAPPSNKPAPLPGVASLLKKGKELRFDPGGKRIPRADRWNNDAFEWEEPVLPPSRMPPPMKAAVAPGPFTQRVQSLFEGRPEAVDRLCAAADARAAVKGEEQLLRELSQELSRKRWQDVRAPEEQLGRLRAIAQNDEQPAAWRSVARFLLERLTSQ